MMLECCPAAPEAVCIPQASSRPVAQNSSLLARQPHVATVTNRAHVLRIVECVILL